MELPLKCLCGHDASEQEEQNDYEQYSDYEYEDYQQMRSNLSSHKGREQELLVDTEVKKVEQPDSEPRNEAASPTARKFVTDEDDENEEDKVFRNK